MEWTQWAPFTPSTINRAPLYQGVYEIALDGKRHQYALGRSATIYIGEAHSDESSIHARLSAHFNGNGNPKIYSLLREYQLKVHWSTARVPGQSERTRLERFEVDFGELPLCNGRL